MTKINFLCGRSVGYHIPKENFVGDYYPFNDQGKDDHMTFCFPKNTSGHQSILHVSLT